MSTIEIVRWLEGESPEKAVLFLKQADAMRLAREVQRKARHMIQRRGNDLVGRARRLFVVTSSERTVNGGLCALAWSGE